IFDRNEVLVLLHLARKYARSTCVAERGVRSGREYGQPVGTLAGKVGKPGSLRRWKHLPQDVAAPTTHFPDDEAALTRLASVIHLEYGRPKRGDRRPEFRVGLRARGMGGP